MQPASTNTGGRNGRSKELRAFQRGTVIGSNTCSHEISFLQNIPQTNIGGIITKKRQLGIGASQQQSGIQGKLTDWGQ